MSDKKTNVLSDVMMTSYSRRKFLCDGCVVALLDFCHQSLDDRSHFTAAVSVKDRQKEFV
jgi:hypothetical protein